MPNATNVLTILREDVSVREDDLIVPLADYRFRFRYRGGRWRRVMGWRIGGSSDPTTLESKWREAEKLADRIAAMTEALT